MKTTRILHRDYETKSTLDLKKVGAHVYAEHPTTDVILAHFAFDDEEPWPWFPGQPVPPAVREHIEAGGEISGHNAPFEACIDRHIMGPRYGFPIPKLEQLDCTMARCAIQSLPLDLDRACMALGLREKKDKEGHRLMLRMCKPRGARKGEDPNGIYWVDDPESIARLSAYCAQDVRSERELGKALRPWTPEEREMWVLDQIINNRGVKVDLDFVRAAKKFADRASAALDARMNAVTQGQVQKATQVDRLKDFARWQGVDFRIDTKTRRNGEEYEAEAADREALEDLLAGELPDDNPDGEPGPVREAFQIRLDAGKASTKKLIKFELQACADGRARGNLQFRAAGPGRWAGRGIQLQNLVRAGIPKKWGGWDACMKDLATLPFEVFELVWGPALDTLSKMLRGALIADEGKQLHFADYSQVEARGTVWSAKQRDMVELFATGGKIYEEMGAFIFKKSVDEIVAGHEAGGATAIWRFVGKEAILGCGYGIGADAFGRNCKKKGKVILPFETSYRAVHGWREKNFRVVEYWRELEDAARAAIETPEKVFWAGPFAYRRRGNWLQLRLPSGRIVWYRKPTLEPDSRDVEQLGEGESVPRYRWKIHYWAVNSVTKQWEKTSTWGGKLLENAVQGMCCDLLGGAMQRLESAGYFIILTVHDEVISEVDDGFGDAEEFVSIMTDVQDWAKGFAGFNVPMPIKAEGGSGYRYAKG
jgi:DNA polymerase bacteriophage-type